MSGAHCCETRTAATAGEVRALHLYELALALVEARGTLVTVGLTKLRELRTGSLLLRYQPAPASLEVWSAGKVLSVRGQDEALRVTRYRPGDWERELEAAVA
ncbi:MAG TPA: hypothetical protein VLW88_13870 [Hyphomicrobium sp.]|jgi:hypothetical protein|nr:hypothetical protein [Hyphomicrobium sp.]